MYTATINNKSFVGGKLTVEVTYSNGNENITEYIDSVQAQPITWIEETIKDKLNTLNSLEYLNDNIAIGKQDQITFGKSERLIYYNKALQYKTYLNIARSGIIRSDRPIIAELHEWLAANFKDEYINMF